MRVRFVLCLVVSLACASLAPAQEPAKTYAFPDEWERHESTLMIFPAARAYEGKARALQREFAAVANAIAKNERVIVYLLPEDYAAAKRLLDRGITLERGAAYRIDWARDNAPLVVRASDGSRKAVCFQFNGWGKKYAGWKEDRGVNLAIAKQLGLPVERSELVLEGGAIEIGSTKQGLTGIVTEQCVLNPNRTRWSKARVERELKERLGLARVIWIPKGLNPDPITDGHVDGLLKFVSKNTVLLHTTDDEDDVNYAPCLEARAILRAAGLKVIELPLADDVVHMNFYIGSGGGVIYVPVSGDAEQDEPALAVLRRLFKRVVTVEARAMAEAGGGIHCYTQQVPRGE